MAILKAAGDAMTPEELFAAGGFDEASVDIFYELLRNAKFAGRIKETHKGKSVWLEAIP